jgi:hypothetical protein
MANFTQLHLGNNSQESSHDAVKNDAITKEQSRKEHNRELSKQKVLFSSGLLAVTVLSGVFLLIANGCSKGPSKGVSQNSGSQNAMQSTAATLPTPPVTPAVERPADKPLHKHVVQRKAPTATFSDPINGISFRYPKTYVLKTGDEPALDVSGMGPVQMNFVQPGGTAIAAIELPRNSYPGTDFSSAFFSVSVNPELSESECSQFAFPLNLQPESETGSPSKTKVGGTEFSMVEEPGVVGDGVTEAPSMRYYHRFQNGNCYEFSLGLSTVASDGAQPVNREQVFRKLEKILATVKVQPAEVPQVAKGTSHPMVEGGKE